MTAPKVFSPDTPRKKKPMTKAWLSNAKTCLTAAGLDLTRLKPADMEYLACMWGGYVDRGADFGSAGMLVVRDLDRAAAVDQAALAERA